MNQPARTILAAVSALSLASLAIVNLAQAESGLTRQALDANGVPMTLFLPANPPAARLPAVLVAHGFSGNRQLMYGFGYTLAKNGYIAALIDFAGHGASLDRLPDSFADDAQYQKLAANISTARDYLRQHALVDPARVAILGHSMGASAVTRYGSARDDVPVTIAISLGSFGQQLPADPRRPRNLLILVGAAEFAGFIQGSTAALRAAYPEGTAGQTYGDFAAGTARRLVYVPGVEHISVLFSQHTHSEVVRWLDQAFAFAPSTRQIDLDARIGWVLMLYIAAALGFYASARLLLRKANAPDWPAVRKRWVIATALIAAVTAPVALWLGLAPYKWMPLTVGNYVGMYFLIYGLITGGAWLTLRRRSAPMSTKGTSTRRCVNGRLIAVTLILASYALVTLGLTAHLTWNNFALASERGWVAGVLFLGCLAFFLADEAMVARTSLPARAGLYALTKLIVLVSLTVAVIALGAPGFILLLIPVMVILFAWHGLYAHWLFGLTGRPWPAAVINASVFAWLIAATFAVVQY